jgi:beta-N-acetylhexosaminidase
MLNIQIAARDICSMILMKRAVRLLIIFFCILPIFLFAQEKPPFYNYGSSVWADSILSKISLDEKIGQLFMAAAWSDKDTIHTNRIREQITKYHIGGLIFFQGGPVRQAVLTNEYQKLSKIPLMIGMDAEWGLAMRIDSTIRFPRQMTLSATGLNRYIYSMGSEIAHECQRLGVHINFAPDADINNNPLNPIIGSRAFSDDATSVSARSLLYMKALQNNHVLACAKHFPGHGDTDTDSHISLPVIHKTFSQLDSLELIPFKKLIADGLSSVMVAHLFLPEIDSTAHTASTLSSAVVNGMLKQGMKFNGLVFTDALNMKGVSSFYSAGNLAVKALLAGNDVLLYSENVPAAIDSIKKAIEEKLISEEDITARVKKILQAKYWVGLNNYKPVDTTNLYRDLNSPEATLLSRKIYESAITILKNKKDILPLQHLDTLSIAAMMMGDSINNAFDAQLKMYAPVNTYTAASTANKEYFNFLLESFDPYDVVIIGLHKVLMKAEKDYGISKDEAEFISTLAKRKKVILCVFGNPYALTKLINVERLAALIISYEDMPVMQEHTAQAIFGGIVPEAKLPVQVSNDFPKGMHSHYASIRPLRLKFSLPEDAGMQSEKLYQVDSIVTAAIKAKAFPGCRVLAARNGVVFYNKSFGYFTYDSLERVTNNSVYDIASVTKVAATALTVMSLYESKKIDLDKPLADYLPSLKNTNKKNIIIRDVLTHQAGLKAFEPFWKKTMKDSLPDSTIYHSTRSKKYWVQVAQDMYMRNEYKDSVNKWLFATPLGEQGKYVYSDFGPILMKQAAERLTHTRFDSLLYKKFYKPLGLTACFRPLEVIDTFLIAPTENDTTFRKQILRGTVHDQSAAMQGGISGNAGLFSNATDLAIIMQMLLNKGEYGGERFFDEETVEEFTRRQFPTNRRGLLFDKPEPDSTKASPVCKSASLSSFGHSGFTGTYVWADPENGLIFIFLSNRVYPDAANDKIVKYNVRTKIHQVFYDAVKK